MENVIDELTYRSYRHNRLMFPQVSVERWTALFPDAAEFERRFLAEHNGLTIENLVSLIFETAMRQQP